MALVTVKRGKKYLNGSKKPCTHAEFLAAIRPEHTLSEYEGCICDCTLECEAASVPDIKWFSSSSNRFFVLTEEIKAGIVKDRKENNL